MRSIRLGVWLALGTLIVIVAAAVAGDFWSRSHAQQVIADRVRSSTGSEHVSVHIGSFPFLYELAVSKINDVTVVASGVPVGPLRLTQVTVDAHKVGVDHHTLIFDKKVRIVSMGRATISLLIRQNVLMSAPTALGAKVSVEGGHRLVVTDFGHQILAVDLSKNPLVPECSFALVQVSDGYQASCTVAPVPTSLLAVLSPPSG
jgi:hypothetical protein